MMDHAIQAKPQEACGLVVGKGSKQRLVRAKNLSHEPTKSFDLDPEAWLEVEDDETVIGIYHSHPQGNAQPSMTDRVGCEASGVPWHIVTLEGHYTCMQPNGFVAPYLQRPYVHGVHDCYSIIRDWYKREWQLDLPNFERAYEWWDKGENLYVKHFASCDFKVIQSQEPQIGDAFFIQIASPVPNHAAIYIGDGMILHHVQGRLSTKDPYGGAWVKHTTHHLRHVSRMEPQHG